MKKKKKDESYGIIPLKREEGSWHAFLIQHQAGHWGFPKGHAEKGESPELAAARELEEETALTIERLILSDPFEEDYSFCHKNIEIDKTVFYFLAEIKGDYSLQQEEICDGKWIPIENVGESMTFSEGKQLAKKVCDYLEGL